MSRRKSSRPRKSSAAPWWRPLALAGAVPFVLAASATSSGSGKSAVSILTPFITGALPILVVAGFLGGLIAWLKLWAGRQDGSTRQARCLDDAKKLDPLHFEHLVADLYRQQGWHAQTNAALGPDEGIDIVLTRGSERVFVQCKRWARGRRVKVGPVRELHSVVMRKGAARGILVTTSTFSDAARQEARGMPLELIDGHQLGRMLAGAPPTASAPPVSRPTPQPPRSTEKAATPRVQPPATPLKATPARSKPTPPPLPARAKKHPAPAQATQKEKAPAKPKPPSRPDKPAPAPKAAAATTLPTPPATRPSDAPDAIVSDANLKALLKAARLEPTTAPSPLCPDCDQPMVPRTAQRGPHQGQSFWGCSGFPACRGKRTVEGKEMVRATA